MKIKNSKLEVSAFNNMDAQTIACAKKIDENTVEVTPWTNITDIYINKGDKIKLSASGSIRLGVFSVACYPDGIDGFRTYNIVDRFKHGSLMVELEKALGLVLEAIKALML